MDTSKLQNQSSDRIIETEEDLRMEIFRNSESEKEKLAKLLHGDVSSLLALMKQYTRDKNYEALKSILSLVSDEIENISFELSPKVFEKYDLLASLKELFTKKMSPFTHEAYNNFIRLPESLSVDMENAIFCIAKTMLSCFDLSYLLRLTMDIVKKDGQIVIAFGLSFNATISPMLKSSFVQKLRPIIYMLSGKMVFRNYSENQMELVVFLDDE